MFCSFSLPSIFIYLCPSHTCSLKTLFEGAQRILVSEGGIDLLLKLCRQSPAPPPADLPMSVGVGVYEGDKASSLVVAGGGGGAPSSMAVLSAPEWRAQIRRFCAGTLANLALKVEFLPKLLASDCIAVMVQLTRQPSGDSYSSFFDGDAGGSCGCSTGAGAAAAMATSSMATTRVLRNVTAALKNLAFHDQCKRAMMKVGVRACVCVWSVFEG